MDIIDRFEVNKLVITVVLQRPARASVLASTRICERIRVGDTAELAGDSLQLNSTPWRDN